MNGGAVLDRAVAAERHCLIELDVEKRIAGLGRNGVAQVDARASRFAARLLDDVVCATDVMAFVRAPNLPMTFLGSPVVVAEMLIEQESLAAHAAVAIRGEVLLRFTDRVPENAGRAGVTSKEFLQAKRSLGSRGMRGERKENRKEKECANWSRHVPSSDISVTGQQSSRSLLRALQFSA